MVKTLVRRSFGCEWRYIDIVCCFLWSGWPPNILFNLFIAPPRWKTSGSHLMNSMVKHVHWRFNWEWFSASGFLNGTFSEFYQWMQEVLLLSLFFDHLQHAYNGHQWPAILCMFLHVYLGRWKCLTFRAHSPRNAFISLYSSLFGEYSLLSTSTK